MTGNFFVGAVTEYGVALVGRVQRGVPDVGLLHETVSGGTGS